MKINNLEGNRRKRSDDQDTKAKLGLRFIGLVYTRDDWRAEPKELFIASDNTQFIKIGIGDYQPFGQPFKMETNEVSASDFNLILEAVKQ